MLDLNLDLAELLLIDPPHDPAPSPAIMAAGAGTLERFVDGLCRTAGAIGGCLVPPGAPHRAVAAIARNDAARGALARLVAIDRTMPRRGYSWIRDEAAPDHCALMIEMPMARAVGVGAGAGAGHVLLLFVRDQLDDEGVIAGILALAPGFGLMAGAAYEASAELAAVERHHHALNAVLRQTECGVVVVDADQGVLFVNPAAQGILDEADGIELRRNMLRPTRYQAAVRFNAALDAVIAPPGHLTAPRERGLILLLDRPGPQRPLIAVLVPTGHEPLDDRIAGFDGAHAGGGKAAAIVCLMRPEWSVTRGLDPICHLHGLSPVETQLVALLVKGLTLAEAAVQMRIKPDTARTYLKQIFAKTDTHRQTDLLQLILRYQRAVSGDFLFEAA